MILNNIAVCKCFIKVLLKCFYAKRETLLRIVKACPENYQDFNLSCVTTTARVSTPRTPRSNYYVQ